MLPFTVAAQPHPPPAMAVASNLHPSGIPLPSRHRTSMLNPHRFHLATHRRPTPLFRLRLRRRCGCRSLHPIRLDGVLNEEESEIGEGFLLAVEELERMARDPSDVLDGIAERLSSRELQLVLVYFAQEGRDSYCALEVFDWLRKENLLDGETRELMASIACRWIERLVDGGRAVGDVVGLLVEMKCVGLETEFSLNEKVVSLYWERGKREKAVEFVKYLMRRETTTDRREEDVDGGALGYLSWKMMADGRYMDAVKLVIEFKECGLNPEAYSYLIALTALVKEQKEFSKNLRRLRISIKKGLVLNLDKENLGLIKKHQSCILEHAALLSCWALQMGSSAISGVVHERLLALYTCAGLGLEAERQLWEMKLAGKEPDRELYNMVLAICASQNEGGSIRRLLAGIEGMSAGSRRKAFLWLLRGYVKGGHFSEASDTLMKMLDLGLCPGYFDRAIVLQGLRNGIKESGSPENYFKLCKRLSDMDLIGPCLVYLHLRRQKLWIMRAL